MERGCTCFLYFPQIFKWTLSPERSHADRGLKYFRLLAESAVDMCRPFLYTVFVVSVFSQPQLTTKNEIGNPFGKVYLFFLLGLFLLILRDFYKPSSGSRKIDFHAPVTIELFYKYWISSVIFAVSCPALT